MILYKPCCVSQKVKIFQLVVFILKIKSTFENSLSQGSPDIKYKADYSIFIKVSNDLCLANIL